MNSTIKTKEKIAQELNHSNENSDTNKESIKDIKTKLRESSKK
jgi:hypothetical protein